MGGSSHDPAQHRTSKQNQTRVCVTPLPQHRAAHGPADQNKR